MKTETWLRWHIGTWNDAKWRLVAKRSGQPVAVVVAIWAAILERAWAQDGSIAGWDAEVVAAGLDLEPADVLAVVGAMQGKTLDGDRLMRWRERQPLREDSSAARTRAYRDRKRADTDGDDERRSVTQCDAEERSETQSDTRREEKRVEEKERTSSLRSDGISAVSADAEPRNEIRPAVDQQNDILFGPGLRFLTSKGIPERQARSVIGKWVKDYGRGEAAAALFEAHEQDVAEPLTYVVAILQNRRDHKGPGRFGPRINNANVRRLIDEQHAEDRSRDQSRPDRQDEPLLPGTVAH